MNGLEVLTVTVRAEIAERESQDKHLGFCVFRKKKVIICKKCMRSEISITREKERKKGGTSERVSQSRQKQ